MTDLTEDEKLKIKKTFGNKDWRMNNLYHIRTKAGKKVKFKMNATQKVLHASKSNLNMTLKGRQQGVTTYYMLNYLDEAMYTRNFTAAILSHDRESIEKIFRVADYAYKNMLVDGRYRPELGRGGGSKYMFYFPSTKSRIYVSLEVRSEAINALHVSEYGLMKNKDRFNASIEAVPPSGDISIESTAMGMNHFYDDWFDPNFPYKKHFFPWYFHYENQMQPNEPIIRTQEEIELELTAQKFGVPQITDAQIAWRRFKVQQRGKGGLKKFLQEHPEDDVSCFMTSGNAVIDSVLLSGLKNNTKPIISQEGGVTVWEEHKRDNYYVVGVDCAEGVGGDYSVATVINKTTREEVAQLRGHIKPKRFAEMILTLCKLYTGARNLEPLLGVERNNHGHAVLLWLEHEGYGNLYKHRDEKIGWHTNSVTRPIMVDRLISAIEDSEIKLNSHDTIGECMTMVEDKGKIEAMKGKHDDCFISVAIGLELCVNNNNNIDWLASW